MLKIKKREIGYSQEYNFQIEYLICFVDINLSIR